MFKTMALALHPYRVPAPPPLEPLSRAWVVPVARVSSLVLGLACIPGFFAAAFGIWVELASGRLGPALVCGVPGFLIALSLWRVSPLRMDQLKAARATAAASIVLNLFLLGVTFVTTLLGDALDDTAREWTLYALTSPVSAFTCPYILVSLGQGFILLEATRRRAADSD